MGIVFGSLVDSDLAKARDWYDEQRPGLGGEFLDDVDRTLEKIVAAPRTHAVIYRDLRLTQLDRFPYVACYRIADSYIELIGVVHTSRHPRIWRFRA